jgi:Esterase-like activity of phytase
VWRPPEIGNVASESETYVVDSGPKYGVNELLAINDHEFPAIERDGRDGRAGADAAFKRLVKIDITGATNVSGIAALPTTGLLLLVTSDNDFFPDRDSLTFAFAIDPRLVVWQPQTFTVSEDVQGVAAWKQLRAGKGVGGQELCIQRDVDRDGLQDLICGFGRETLKLGKSSTATFSGQTKSGTPVTSGIAASDCDR